MTEGTTTAEAPARTDTVDWLALGAALLTVMLWASAFVGIRAVADDLSPGSFALGRLLVAAAALGVIVALRRPALPRHRSDWMLIAVSGVVWFGGYFIALNAGEGLVDAGTAAMLVNVGPILIAIFAGLFLAEGFPPRLVIGSVIAFSGTLVIGVATGAQAGQENAPLGVLLCLIAAVAYAIGVTVQKPALARVPALSVTAIACAIGAVVTLPFAPLLIDELGSAPPDAIAWIVYLGIFPTAIAFTTWAFALNRTTAGRLGSTTYLVPPVAIGLAWLMLTEVPPALAFVGGALCIGGVIVARSRGRLGLGRRST
ncbi:MAG TPA: DMT family transporter [Candidatus Limnocylindria bacterium]|nr:DMT family transporter [Candidatus Limnocylindria bacterium]